MDVTFKKIFTSFKKNVTLKIISLQCNKNVNKSQENYNKNSTSILIDIYHVREKSKLETSFVK